MGQDYWDYSIAGSRSALDALTKYLYEQGLTKSRMGVHDLFVTNVQDDLKKYLHGTEYISHGSICDYTSCGLSTNSLF